MLQYLIEQDWFFHLDLFDANQVVEDYIFDELGIHDGRERRLFATAFYHFAIAIHDTFDEYRIHADWVRSYLRRAGVVDRFTRDVIFLESIPVKAWVITQVSD